MARYRLGRFRLASLLTALALVPTLAGVPTAASAAGSAPQPGGTMTVLENAGLSGAWPQGLDPATNTSDLADDPYMESIYGNLFEQQANGKMVPDLASGYKFIDGNKTLEIFLRHGVTFQDGTPFNAAAVAWNIKRDLDPANACICDSSFPVASITTQGKYTVLMHLKTVYAPILESFAQAAPNWIASPTAYQKMGAKAFALNPVGAGPFQVVSDTVNSKLVLKKYDHYWQKGHPYLDNLVFESIGQDQSAYSAIVAGQANLEQGTAIYAVVQAAEKNSKIKVTTIPGAGSGGIQLNTLAAPFNNIKAREAIYYATDPQALNKALSGGTGTVSQSGDGPASLFPDLKVPGYRTYDLAKAKALVQQLGGLSFTITDLSFDNFFAEALQSEWMQAGMKVQINPVPIITLNKAFATKNWDVVVPGGCGGTDPAIGLAGMAWRCLSTGPFTGLDDHKLDSMINAGTGTLNVEKRAKTYSQIFEYLSQHAYIPFTYAAATHNIASTNAHGPGIDSPLATPWWQDAWISH